MEKVKTFFMLISSLEQVQIIFKLVLVAVLAGVLGYERESYKKPAGFRTYILVGISGVLVTLAGQKLHEIYGSDAARIPAQLISGIGFLGAGTILRDGFHVKGLTTAAGLLSIACIGLVVGTGYYFCAIISTIIVYCVLSYSHLISSTVRDFNALSLKIKSSSPKSILDNIKNIFNSEKIEVIDLKITEDEYILISFKSVERVDKNKLFAKIMKIETVLEVSEIESEELV